MRYGNALIVTLFANPALSRPQGDKLSLSQAAAPSGSLQLTDGAPPQASQSADAEPKDDSNKEFDIAIGESQVQDSNGTVTEGPMEITKIEDGQEVSKEEIKDGQVVSKETMENGEVVSKEKLENGEVVSKEKLENGEVVSKEKLENGKVVSKEKLENGKVVSKEEVPK